MRGAAVAAGLALALMPGLVPPPAGLALAGWQVLGLVLAMALWWIAETIPLAATALVPLALFPLAGIAPIGDVAPAYAHPLIILFLGGFLLARALEHHGLHQRLAAGILRIGGGGPRMTVGSLMLATAFLSLWISNTASAMIMAPIGAAILAARPADAHLGAAMLLGIAYAATIGGMGSLIGTPPNALFAAYMAERHGVTIGFAEWAAVGLPVVAVLLPVAWLVLTRVAFHVAGAPLGRALAAPGLMTPAARRCAVIVVLTALALLARPALAGLWPDLGLTDAGIAISGALVLFLVSDGRGGRLLDWEVAQNLRWDVLILFGGGLALADGIDRSGLAEWFAAGAASLSGWSVPALIAVFAALIVLVGEVASNTAMAAIFLPIAGASAIGLGVDPLLFTLPVALAASIGFMLPVATPPNAIVFSHPAVTRMAMLRAGAPLDLICTAVALIIAQALAPIVFGP